MKNINISISYITNFKPSYSITESFNYTNNNSNIILCKNFIIFFYLMRFLFKNNTSVKIFLKPSRKKIETILRPPYRHKISRHQITISRYFFLLSFSLPLKFVINLTHISQLNFLIFELKNYFFFFESNICYTHSAKIRFFFYFGSFFYLLNYKII